MTSKEPVNTRVLMCEPLPARKEAPPHRAWWQKTVEQVARTGLTLDFTDLKKGYLGLSTYEQSYNGVQMAQRAYEAEKKGYDAFIIGCASDMGLKECRALMARAVKEDGAETLFVSCIVTSALLNMKGVREVEGAPVIDTLAASLKMAEAMVDLKRAYGIGVSRRSAYLSPGPGWEKRVPD